MKRPDIKEVPAVQYCIPVGGLMDLTTGEYIPGIHDQMVLNGGVNYVTGVVGPGNTFKSTLVKFMEFVAMQRIYQTVPDTWGDGYDTEINANIRRAARLAEVEGRFPVNLVTEGVWRLTNKAMYQGEDFWTYLKDTAKTKREDKKPQLFDTAFLNRDGTVMKVMQPNFADIDSLSKFMTSNVEDTLEKADLADSAGNTVFMKQGLAKSKMLMEIPYVAASGQSYYFVTAHVGPKIEIASGPMAPIPKKQLQFMNSGEVIKGVGNDFFYLLHNCWYVTSCRPLQKQDDRSAEYPREPAEVMKDDKDLMVLTVRQLRGKNGQSGFSLEILCSQEEGVLPSLTEFHYLRGSKQFGMVGSDRNYAMAILPDVNMQRTTVRKQLRENKKLRRAVEITSQIAQLYQLHRSLKDLLMEPEELYTKIKEAGYDWDFILEHTRGWSTLSDDEHPGYHWSTLDILRAARGLYHPYWMEDDKKTIKPQYAKLKKEGYFE